ncbi:hypothetical protein SAMN06295885_2508 [Rathayibacter oskolensis]|uniref:Uncharacterized protein n=1 Tax=Rathayibacter oskolensis TaxID=1891671 RepID=A0A1X7P4I9_9MICO|nr:hypothetical protein [Rathayibacter oskolensis]SMH45287.1 hypothetical protein SAMN06295885_2508 [Rathayibacter oskolensis]
MSQIPMGPPTTPPATPPGQPGQPASGRRPLGTGGWIAIASSAVVGLLYTAVLGGLLALSVGAAVDVAADAVPTDVPGFTDDPFGSTDDPFGSTDDPFAEGDSSDPYFDYPGYEDGDAAVVLDQPSAEAAIAVSTAAVAAVEAAVIGEWESADDEYYERTDNVYGGPSLLYNYISATDYAVADLSTAADKQAVVDLFTAAVAPLGFDEIDIADTPGEWSQVGYDFRGDLTDEEASASLWVVTAYSTTQSVPAIELGLVDLDSDPSGEVQAMLDDVGVTPSEQGAFLAGYANSILEEGDRAEFTDRMEEFGGVAAT